VSNCTPLSSVRKIITDVVVTGSRSGSSTTEGGVTKTWTGVAHRSATDTVRRIFTGSTETSRAHGAFGAAHDTTTFTEGDITRVVAEAAHDTVKALTWNLPRSSNPWPVSGSIVRVDTVHIAVSRGTQSASRDVVRTIEIDFPADAQGNVVLKINDKTCSLNLTTHAVTNCQ
jgi:hypothetical protein